MEEVIGSILTSKSKYLANPTFSQNGSCHQWNQVLVQRTDVFQVRQFYLAYRRESRQRLDFYPQRERTRWAN